MEQKNNYYQETIINPLDAKLLFAKLQTVGAKL